MSPLIAVKELSYRTADGRTLFENLDLAFGPERTGLVGRNGVGKTTLLRLMLGELEPLSGCVIRRGRIGVLRQVFSPPPGASVADLLGVTPALERLERIADGSADDADLEEADWTLEARIRTALDEVGLGGLELSSSAASLSGGQATRLALAALVIEAPDLILLDEPTNNLDAEARAFVADAVGRWRGGAVVVSHDRALLGRMDRIVELVTLGVRAYGGGYELYAARKAEEEAAGKRELEVAEREAARLDRRIQAARERKARRDAAGWRSRARGGAPKLWLDAQAERAERSGAAASRLAERQREAAAEALEAARTKVEQVRRLGFSLPASGLAGAKAVLTFEDVRFRYGGGPMVLDGVSFRLSGRERAAVTGPNGAGKTTFLKLAVGELEPTRGRILRGVPSTLLDQRTAVLKDELSLLENFRRLNPRSDHNAGHAALARFLFRNEAALRPAGAISGGERLRAALACVLSGLAAPQLLVLDEPTNHLDLDSLEAVERALAEYDGALLVVSHDAAFLDAIGIQWRIDLGLNHSRP